MDGIFGLVATTDRDRLVGRDCKTRRNDLRELKTLELKEATADVGKIGGIKLSTSDLAEEMVKRIIATLASFVVVSGRRDGAVVSHGAIAGVLDRWMWLVILVGVMLASVITWTRHRRSIIVLPDLSCQSVTIV